MQRISVALFLGLSLGVTAQTEIYNEDFQSGIPMSYSIVDNDNLTVDASVSEFAPGWIALEDPDTPGDTVAGSTSFFDPSGRADRWLITEPIALGATGNVLFWSGKSHDASFPDAYYIFVSTTDNQLSSFNDTIYYNSAESADWVNHQISLSGEGYNNVTVYIAFVNRTNDGFKLYIDDIRVEEDNPLGFVTTENNVITVFPNPAQDRVTINGTFDQYHIYSPDGKLISSGSEKLVDLQSFDSGVYTVVIQHGSRIQQERIIKL